MKRTVAMIASACMCFALGTAFVGCGSVAVEELSLSKTSLNLDSGAEYTISYDVAPADGTLVYEILSENGSAVSTEGVFEYSVSEGEVTITATSAGTGVFRIRAKSDASIYADCSVTVKLPDGYAAYRGEEVKFAYPSSWSKNDVPQTDVAYCGIYGSNVNMTSESKNNIYFSASSKTFSSAIERQYAAINYTVSDMVCTVTKYDSNKAVRVDYDYVLSSGYIRTEVSQVQFIRSTSSKTYVLTVTEASEDVIRIMQNEFRVW